MSKFYSEIAKYYDYIFPLGKAQVELLIETAGEPPKRILDVACGSGLYVAELIKRGYDVTAVDLDEAMVERTKARNLPIRAEVMNMLDIRDLEEQFDLIFCIGNSLVHLNDDEEVFAFLQVAKSCLNERGKIVLQIVNYDRVLAHEVKRLPDVKDDGIGLLFERFYEYQKEMHKIAFTTVLRVDGQVMTNTVQLHPLVSENLGALLEAAGFTAIRFYGSFTKERYKAKESFALVVVAQA